MAMHHNRGPLKNSHRGWTRLQENKLSFWVLDHQWDFTVHERFHQGDRWYEVMSQDQQPVFQSPKLLEAKNKAREFKKKSNLEKPE